MSEKKTIVVLQSGFVFIGVWHPATLASATAPSRAAYITEASNIRKWGTTAGLGEIALTGPTKETVMDPCGTVVLDNPQALLFTIPCQ